jgi:hypothetical protein
MHQLKEKGILMVGQDQERIPISYDNNSGIGRDDANAVDDHSRRGGKKTGFVERKRKVSGAGFAQALVFSFMANPASTREEVRQAAAMASMQLSTPGLDKRFTAKAAYFLDSLLAEAVAEMVDSLPHSRSLLSRFNGVYVGDSTIIGLPETLAAVFRGNNGVNDSAVKVAVQWELSGGSLGLWLSDGTVHDQRTGMNARPLPMGALRLNDLGLFNLTTFADDQANGVYFFSRYKVGTLVYRADGQPLDLVHDLPRHGRRPHEWMIQLGVQRLPCRLIALPVPPAQIGQRRQRLRQTARRKQQPLSERVLTLAAWTLYVTNVPPDLLDTQEAAILGCTRWQIECLFKLWKSSGLLDESRSHDPYRVWCEFYAKLLALLIQHWVMVVSCWQHLNRSLHRATQLLRKQAFTLLDTLTDLAGLINRLRRTAHLMAATCGLSKRAAKPLTFQRWLEAAYV